MKEEARALVDYRFERARESLEEAKLLVDGGHGNACVNRLYYACFYAVSALLLIKGLTSSKHSGIRSLFHQNLVKPGLIDGQLGRLYDDLYDSRQKADYVDMVKFDIAKASQLLEETKQFILSTERVFADLKD
jgi:uncharacterized protein (UPF0332 family)